MRTRSLDNSIDLIARLTRMRGTLRRRLLLFGACAVASGGVGALLVIVGLDWALQLPAVPRLIVGGLYLVGFALALNHWIVRPLRARLTLSSLAVHLDHHFPELNDRLASSVQFLETEGDYSPTLRARMLDNTRAVFARLPLAQSLTLRPLLAGAALMLAAGMALAGSLAAKPMWLVIGTNRYLDPFGGVSWPTRVEIAGLTRDAFVAYGDSATVSMRVVRGQSPDLRAIVHLEDDRGQATALAMNHRADGVYTCTLDNLTATQRLWFAAGDASTRAHPRTLRVVHPPRIAQAVARIHAPSYAADRPVKSFDLSSGVPRVVAGSRVELDLIASKAIRETADGPQAALRIANGGQLVLTRVTRDATRLHAEFLAVETVEFTPHVVDEHGFANRDAPRWRIEAIDDVPPTVVLREPRGTLEVTPSAELRAVADATDDLGVAGMTLEVARDDDLRELPLTLAQAGDPQDDGVLVRGSGGWSLAELGASVGDVLTLRAAATDNYPSPDGGQRAFSPTQRVVVIDPATLERREQERIRRIEGSLRDTTLALEQLADRVAQLDVADAAAIGNTVIAQRRINATIADLHKRAHNSGERLDTNAAGDEPTRAQLRMIERDLSAVLDGPLVDALERLEGVDTSARRDQAASAQNSAARRMHAVLRALGEWDDFANLVNRIRDLLDRQQAAGATRERDLAALADRAGGALDEARAARTTHATRVQRLIAEDTERLLTALRQTTRAASSDATHRDALVAALRAAVAGDVVRAMFDAAAALADERLGATRVAQRTAEAGLNDMLAAIADERQRELADLARALEDARASVQRLHDDARELADATQEALAQQASADTFDALGDRQYTLAGNTEQLAETWKKDAELAGFASQLAGAHAPLRAAAGALFERDASAALDQQASAIAQFAAVLDALAEDAMRAKHDANQQQLALIHARLVALHARQNDVNAATGELIAQIRDGASLGRLQVRKAAALASDQGKIREETQALRDELHEVVLFAFALDRAGKWMQSSADGLTERQINAELTRVQQRIAAELAMLIRALHDMRDLPPPDAYARRGARGGGQANAQETGPPVPPLAELLVLKALQQDISARTTAQAERLDPDGASEAQLQELRELATEQQALRDLTRQLTEEARKHEHR